MPGNYAMAEIRQTLIVRNVSMMLCIVVGKLFFYDVMFGYELHHAVEIKKRTWRVYV